MKRDQRTKKCVKDGEEGECTLKERCAYGRGEDRNCCYVIPCNQCGKKMGYSVKKYLNPYRPFETSGRVCFGCSNMNVLD